MGIIGIIKTGNSSAIVGRTSFLFDTTGWGSGLFLFSAKLVVADVLLFELVLGLG